MQHIKTISMESQVGAMYNKQEFSNPKRLILLVSDMAIKFMAVWKYV